MSLESIDQARKLLTEDGFSTELSSIMVDDSFYIGHKVHSQSAQHNRSFKISAEVDTLTQLAESCENIVLLAKSLHQEYDCDISLRKSHMLEYKPDASPIKNPTENFVRTPSLYTSYLELMRRGWGYSDKIQIGEGITEETQRRITLSRWNWHDKSVVSPILFYETFPNDADALEIFEIVLDRAFTAWEKFGDSIPFQDANGKMRPSFQANHLAQSRDSNLFS